MKPAEKLGAPEQGLSVRIQAKPGKYSEISFDYVDAEGILYKDVQEEEAPPGISSGRWGFIRTMAFMPFSNLTTETGHYKGRFWSAQEGTRPKDVLSQAEIYEVISAQYIWDGITGRKTDKISVT